MAPTASSALTRLPDAGKRALLDSRPIALGAFTLQAHSVAVKGKPTPDQWADVFRWVQAVHGASPYWIGDLTVYLRDRAEWAEIADQLMASTGLAEQTIQNLASVSRRVAPHERELAPTISHAHEVAALERPQQTKWLETATDEGWTARELRQHITASKRRLVIEGQAVMDGRYRVWLADPPWGYRDSGATADGSLAKSEGAYRTMSMADIMAFPVAQHAEDNAIMFLWVPATMLYESPGPRDVLDAWGFTPKTNIVWNKVVGMPGHYGFQVTHEHVIVATRGSCLPDVPLPHENSVLTVRRKGEHSEKPDELRAIIDKHWTLGRKVEVFGRKAVDGWHVLGDDPRLWATVAVGA